MYELPNEEKRFSKKDIETWLKKEKLEKQSINKHCTRKHIFSHIEWNMICYEIYVKEKNSRFIWATPKDLESKYAIPTAFLPFLKEIDNQ